MTADALARFGAALLLTILSEAPVAWLLGLRSWQQQCVLLLINVITNPLLNLLINALSFLGYYTVSAPYDPMLLALECAVVVAEALLLKVSLGKSTGRVFVISLAANAASWLAGAMLLWR